MPVVVLWDGLLICAAANGTLTAFLAMFWVGLRTLLAIALEQPHCRHGYADL